MDRNTGILTHDRRKIVALRKESVDRNFLGRRKSNLILIVALRKESVDRNSKCCFVILLAVRRSPQGERG